MKRLVLFLAIVVTGLGSAESSEHSPKVIAEGKWSKPVSDSQGYSLRGRLVLCEKSVKEKTREIAVYIEIQDASQSIGNSMQLYCDLGKHDFRPEYKSGLQCDLRDGMNNPVPQSPFAFSGAVPKSQWLTLPTDGTIRLRASPFGIYRPHAKVICPHLGSLWVIADDDPNEYFLAGTFFIAPPAENRLPEDGHVWKGILELPAVQLRDPK